MIFYLKYFKNKCNKYKRSEFLKIFTLIMTNVFSFVLGLYLMGFKPISSLKKYFHVRPGNFIYPDEKVTPNRVEHLPSFTHSLWFSQNFKNYFPQLTKQFSSHLSGKNNYVCIDKLITSYMEVTLNFGL